MNQPKKYLFTQGRPPALFQCHDVPEILANKNRRLWGYGDPPENHLSSHVTWGLSKQKLGIIQFVVRRKLAGILPICGYGDLDHTLWGSRDLNFQSIMLDWILKKDQKSTTAMFQFYDLPSKLAKYMACFFG